MYRNKVNPKVVAASGGAGLGYAVGQIAVYYLEKIGGDVPPDVEGAMVLVVSAAVAFAAGYLKAE